MDIVTAINPSQRFQAARGRSYLEFHQQLQQTILHDESDPEGFSGAGVPSIELIR